MRVSLAKCGNVLNMLRFTSVQIIPFEQFLRKYPQSFRFTPNVRAYPN